jgi:DNA-directed RNA polymerase subunit F
LGDVDEVPTLDPETVNEFRREIRQGLDKMGDREIVIEAATNAWVAVRILHRIQEPRIRRLELRLDESLVHAKRIEKLEQKAALLQSLFILGSVVGPIAFTVLGWFIGAR